MARLQLSSKTRTDFRKSVTKNMRIEGRIPATIYGRGEDPKSVEVCAEELGAILRTPGGRLSLINLDVDGKGEASHPVLIQDLQRDPISKKIMHVDFHRVSMNEPVHASIPLHLVGEAPGVKMHGVLEQVTYEVNIKALPDHIPAHIDVDISKLEIGQNIHVGDLAISSDIEVLSPQADTVVATVRIPSVQLEEETASTEASEEAAPAAEEAKE